MNIQRYRINICRIATILSKEQQIYSPEPQKRKEEKTKHLSCALLGL